MVYLAITRTADFVPINTTSQNKFDQKVEIFKWLLVVAAIIIPLLYRWWRKREANKFVVDAPLLMGIYTEGMRLTKMTDGILGVYPYTLMMTEPIERKVPDGPVEYSGDGNSMVGQAVANAAISAHNMSNAGKVILALTLPVKSPVHITCIGINDDKTRAIFSGQIAGCNLEDVGLEGNFPDYFNLYCDSNHQVEVREVLDPTAMAFFIDFCQHEDWELFEDTLYFAGNNINSAKNHDGSTMVEDAENFVQKALPVLQRMTKDQVNS